MHHAPPNLQHRHVSTGTTTNSPIPYINNSRPIRSNQSTKPSIKSHTLPNSPQICTPSPRQAVARPGQAAKRPSGQAYRAVLINRPPNHISPYQQPLKNRPFYTPELTKKEKKTPKKTIDPSLSIHPSADISYATPLHCISHLHVARAHPLSLPPPKKENPTHPRD